MAAETLTIGIAFLAGLISFLSPCVLPLVPAFLSYLAGTSIKDIKEGKANKLNIFLNSVLFVLGFSVVFAVLGVLLNNFLADISFTLRQWLGYIGGAIIIFFGLYLLKLVPIPWLDREHKFKAGKRGAGYFTSFLFGAAFAAGWTPCVGAVLGSVLTLAAVQPGIAFTLLMSYAIGLGIPFLLVGIFTSQSAEWISKSGKWLEYFNYVVGVLLIILGILVFTGQLAAIANLGFVSNLLG